MATFYLGMATFFLGMATLFLGLATFFLGIIFFSKWLHFGTTPIKSLFSEISFFLEV